MQIYRIQKYKILFKEKRKKFLLANSYCCKYFGSRLKGRNVNNDSTAAVALDWITKQAAHLEIYAGKILSNVSEYRTVTVFVQSCSLDLCQV